MNAPGEVLFYLYMDSLGEFRFHLLVFCLNVRFVHECARWVFAFYCLCLFCAIHQVVRFHLLEFV